MSNPQEVQLPQHYGKDKVRDVTTFSDRTRKKRGLSTQDTIIEIVGDQFLVREAVEYARKKGITAFDLETTGLNPFREEIVLVQIGDRERQYLIWYQTIDPTPITELLGDKDVVKVGANLKFDLVFWLVKHGLKARAWNVADIQLIEQVLDCGLTGKVGQTLTMTGMGPTAKRWLGLALPKDEEIRTGWGDMEPGNWNTYRDGTLIPNGQRKRYYAADDVCIPISVIKKQKPWILELGLTNTVSLEHLFLPVLAEMEARGLRVDQPAWMELYREAQQKRKDAERKLDALFDVTQKIYIDEAGEVSVERDKNYGSPSQLLNLISDYMLEQYGIEVIGTNAHFERALRAHGTMNPLRIEKLFTPRKEPNPKDPKKNIKVASPKGKDVIQDFYNNYRRFLPEEHFLLMDTDSKTLKLMKALWEEDEDLIEVWSGKYPDDYEKGMPTNLGLPPDLVDPILAFRKNEKSEGTYGKKWLQALAQDGRVHANVIQGALDTGRLSSSPNVMNLPSDARYRACFVPKKGYKFIGRDWSQIEPRIIAQMSLDETYMRVFWSEFPGSDGYKAWCPDKPTEKLDLYIEVGKKIGLIPEHYTIADCKGDNAKPDGVKGRKQAKIVVLGLGYGTGLAKFWRTLITDTDEYHEKGYASDLYWGFWGGVPMVKDTLDGLSALADPESSARRIWHPFAKCEVTWAESIAGRKRFFWPSSNASWTQGRNMPVQATGADILKWAAVFFTHWLWKHDIDAGIVNFIHDEFLVEISEKENVDAVNDKLGKVMTKVGEHYCPDVPITSDGYADDMWIKD